MLIVYLLVHPATDLLYPALVWISLVFAPRSAIYRVHPSRVYQNAKAFAASLGLSWSRRFDLLHTCLRDARFQHKRSPIPSHPLILTMASRRQLQGASSNRRRPERGQSLPYTSQTCRPRLTKSQRAQLHQTFRSKDLADLLDLCVEVHV